MIRGWTRVWRKILDNDIFHDANALKVFMWLMLTVDRQTGKKIIGRFWAAQNLRLNPSTFYKVLKRLEKKYKIVTLKVTTKSTEISLVNWHKYQSSNTFSNNKVTTKEQQSNTIQEYIIKNKEYNNILPANKLQDTPKIKNYSPTQERNNRICKYFEDTLKTKFTNYKKQLKALQMIFKAGYTEEQIYYVIREMVKDDFYQDKGFDLMTVMNAMPRYKAMMRKRVS